MRARQRLAARVRRLLTSTGLLLLAVLVFVAALVLVIALLPPMGGFPPWADRAVDQRLQISALVVGVLGLGGVLLTLGAGILELREIFPTQSLSVRVIRLGDDDDCPVRQWRVVVQNGESMIAASRIEVRAWAIRGGVRNALRAVDAASWGHHKTDRDVWVREDGLYPGQAVDGPIFELADEDASMIWLIRWWTERGALHQHSAMVHP